LLSPYRPSLSPNRLSPQKIIRPNVFRPTGFSPNRLSSDQIGWNTLKIMSPNILDRFDFTVCELDKLHCMTQRLPDEDDLLDTSCDSRQPDQLVWP